MSHKIIARISKKSGVTTLTPEGVTGPVCKEITRPLEEGLGMRELERQELPEMYQTTEQQTEQQQGAQ